MRARERVISDFEKGMGLGGGMKRAVIREGEGNASTTTNGSGSKGEMERLASEAEERALKVIEQEQVEARKTKLAAFWLPSMAPEARNGLAPIKDAKLEALCPAGTDPHPFS